MPTQIINLNDTTPAAPVGMTNVRWQADPPSLDPAVARNVSAYVPPVSGVLHAGIGVPPNSALGSPAAILQSAFVASRTANFSSAVTAGNLLIVITFGAQNAQPVTISDTVGTHYGSVVWDTSANDDTASDGIVVFAGIAAGSGANAATWSCGTVTVGLSTIGEPSAPMTMVLEVSGAEITISGTFATVDSTAVTPSTGLASSTSLGLTASQGADFVIAVAKLMTSYGYPVTFTPGSPLTSVVTVNPTSGSDPNRPAVLAAGQIASAGAIAATIGWTGNTGAGHAMVAAAFKTTSTPIGLGADGDFYLDTSTGILYGPRAGGVWNPTTGGRIVQPDGTTITITGVGQIAAATMVGDSGSGGSAGLVPAPAAGDAAAGRVLKADGTWYTPPFFSNPLVAQGDLIVGGASGAPARLAAGGVGYVLTSNAAGSAVSWQPGAGGGGIYAPVVRGSGIQASSASSYTVAWPSGTVAGDMALIFGGHGYAFNVPSGWAPLDVSSGTQFNGAIFGRILTSADISAGSVVVTTAGSFDGVLAIMTIVGLPGSIKGLFSARNSSGSFSITISPSNFALATDLVVCFGSNRAASTDTCSLGTQLQQANDGYGASGCLYAGSLVSPAWPAVTFSYSGAGSGNYQAVVVLGG